MRFVIIALLSGSMYAASNAGIVLWLTKSLDGSASNLMSNTGGSRSYGGAIKLPLTLLMGSNLEFGLSNLPDQSWNDPQQIELRITDRRKYIINSLYMLSDSISAILGLAYRKQELSCSTNCIFQEKLKNRFNYHVGIEWTMPVVEHLDSGLRVLYNFQRSHDYCYGANCSSQLKIDQKQLELQMVAIASL